LIIYVTDAGMEVSEALSADPSTIETSTSAPTVIGIDELEGSTTVQDQDGTIRIEGLDFSTLSKNMIVTIEKLESPEVTYILHTEPGEGLATEQGEEEEENTDDDETANILELAGYNTKLVKSQGKPDIRKLSDVKITPVRAYITGESEGTDTRDMSTSTQTEESDTDDEEEEEPIEVMVTLLIMRVKMKQSILGS